MATTQQDLRMTEEELVKFFERNCEELCELLKRKRGDYGRDNIRRFGEEGVLIRLYDKWERAWTLVSKKKDPDFKEESLRDTYLDIMGYGNILLALLEGVW